jgi:ABC-type Fe3+/spermidine/putrescine transport system ATPase subunit
MGTEVRTKAAVAAPTHTAAAAVRLDHISKTYSGHSVPAVRDLSIEIREGELFSLLGPSGCGKTTTLRILAGLENPDAGAIYFKDRPIVSVRDRLFVPPEKRQIGMVFQSYAVWPHMTVEANVGYPLRVRGMRRRDIAATVERTLALVGLSELAKKPAPLLSGGQQQRVALARALVYEPSLLLLDEPFSNLDSKLREQMRIEVKLLQARLKVTVMLVTHDQVEALSLSNRIAVMNEGRVLQVGRPRELYEHPASDFVRDFLGRTVVLRGRVRDSREAGRVAIAVDGAPACIVHGTMPPAHSAQSGDPVFFALRPEDARLLPAGAGEATAGTLVRGTVEATLFVGDRTDYRINVHGQGSILLYGERHDSREEGSEVSILLPSECLGVWSA